MLPNNSIASKSKRELLLYNLLSYVWLFATLWTAARWGSVPDTLPEIAQTHVHQLCDAIQSSHPLSPLSPALNLSQHQGSS